MKHFMPFSKLVALSLALAAITSVNPAQAVTNAGTQQGQAKVSKITGVATFKAANGQSGDLKVDQILKAGASISTGPAATVELNLGVNGQLLIIVPDTTVELDQLDFSGTGADTVVNTRLNLVKGGLNGNVKKLARNSKYEVKTATGVAGIRGTSYSVNAAGVVHVWQGSVMITYVVNGVKSAPVEVKAGVTMYPPTTPGGVPTPGQMVGGFQNAATQRITIEDGDNRNPGDKGPAPTEVKPVVYVSPVTGVTDKK